MANIPRSKPLINNTIEIDRKFIEYIDLMYLLMGVDMNYDKFKNLSQDDKQSFIRDIKIKMLTKNDISESK